MIRLMRGRDLADKAWEYDQWLAQHFDYRRPAEREFLQKNFPDFVEKRLAQIQKDMYVEGMERVIQSFGPTNRGDCDFMFAREHGLIETAAEAMQRMKWSGSRGVINKDAGMYVPGAYSMLGTYTVGHALGGVGYVRDPNTGKSKLVEEGHLFGAAAMGMKEGDRRADAIGNGMDIEGIDAAKGAFDTWADAAPGSDEHKWYKYATRMQDFPYVEHAMRGERGDAGAAGLAGLDGRDGTDGRGLSVADIALLQAARDARPLPVPPRPAPRTPAPAARA
jgi:hypothetical protein